jgi:bis(5'-nucleosyl)-tetraphosphatase (symmetrical)
MTASPRIAIVGDVHGCIEELDELLERLALRPGVDRLVMVGDLLDRGPDPVAVLRRARQLGAEVVLGNHEEKHLRYRRHEVARGRDPRKRNPMQPFTEERIAQHRALSHEDWRYIESWPSWLRLPGGFAVVHAGLEPRWPLDRQRPSIVCRVRDVDSTGSMATSGDPRVPSPGSVPWALRWPGPESIVYGHHVHGLETPRVDRPRADVECWGIDTGCVFGGRLTAPVLPDREIVQVPARRAYLPLHRDVLD